MVQPAEQSKSQETCRICGSTKLFEYLNMGQTPLANSYLRPEQLGTPEFKEELALQVCTDCGLSQLTKVVSPDLMFRHYLYVSSTTETFRKHCVDLAKTATAVAGCRESDWVLDVASNDGCLLSKFRELGMRVVGVDPAENLAAEANKAGIPTLCAYWSPDTAETVMNRYGRPKVITATNVFAHVDDVHAFVRAVDRCLAPKGVFVIECPYAVDFIEKNEFDTAYHEHLSYIGVHPLLVLMERHGLTVFNVEYFKDIHGGTIRAFVGRAGDYQPDPSVAQYLKREAAFGIKDVVRYEAFGKRVRANKHALVDLIGRLHADGKIVWAYGASAKGNTLMNYFGISNRLVPVVIDDNPKKWGWYAPGSQMRIAGIEELTRSKVDYLLLLAWNFESEIRRRCAAARYGGGFILPVPEARVIESTAEHHT
jgi:SAM-dependent methyltransferase